MSKNKLSVLFAAAATVVAAPSVFAAEGAAWDYTAITNAVDFTSVSVGVMAVAALLAAVYAGIRGAKIVLGFFKSGS